MPFMPLKAVPPVIMPSPLLAAGLDWLEGLLPVLFVLIWIASQVWAVFRRVAAPKPPVGPVLRPAPPRVEELRDEFAQRDVRLREELERQIEAFLGERRGKPAAPPVDRGDRRAATQQREPATAEKRSGRRAAQTTDVRRPRLSSEAPTPGVPRERAMPPALLGGDVARHVDEAFASDLKHRIAPASMAEPIAPVRAEPATDLVSLLHDPASLRQLVIIREVLDRPVDRW
jgi:hypothetical protein